MTAQPHHAGCDLGDYDDMCDQCQTAIDATKCSWCNGTGVYEDETISRECPWCRGTGEADA